ncbi:Hpt domain-containing protein [Desulfovibrio psychrotolerans]|uniref:HPt domain-containing protein n=1 Tax=Desulfovibrio psychrotolerans TaxID=415242 RepID=A0A7J0BQC6_9BACT|nr:Hpt domain-containing protein [Desulfovibrio psychrotolerans]GFM35335.1 hypothetical protein DSM19430T_00190 [Desulfovibrio psychrotolerans]
MDPMVPVLNTEAALHRMCGNTELLRLLLDTFLEDAPGKVQRIQTYAEAGDAFHASTEAHGLKGAAATVGAERIAQLAQSLEKLLREYMPPAETPRNHHQKERTDAQVLPDATRPPLFAGHEGQTFLAMLNTISEELERIRTFPLPF